MSFEHLAGDPDSPVLLHVPHSATHIPGWVRNRILLTDAQVEAELATLTDARTDLIADAAANATSPRPWQFVNRLSRLVIDPERFPDDREELNVVGMGAVYTRTADGRPLRDEDASHRADLISRYFEPYSSALADAVDARIAAVGRAVIIDVHSFPRQALSYELHKNAARPELCLGTDRQHTPEWLMDAAAAAFGGWDIAFDEPFVGTYVPLRHYGRDDRVASIMIEIRRDTHADPAGFDRVVRGLAQLIQRCNDRAPGNDGLTPG